MDFFVKPKTAYGLLRSVVGLEICIRDRFRKDPSAAGLQKSDVSDSQSADYSAQTRTCGVGRGLSKDSRDADWCRRLLRHGFDGESD